MKLVKNAVLNFLIFQGFESRGTEISDKLTTWTNLLDSVSHVGPLITNPNLGFKVRYVGPLINNPNLGLKSGMLDPS